MTRENEQKFSRISYKCNRMDQTSNNVLMSNLSRSSAPVASKRSSLAERERDDKKQRKLNSALLNLTD